MNMDLRYIVYCRKSTEAEDRQVLSLPDQKRELEKVIANQGLTVVKRYAESASAYKLGRHDFNDMIQLIHEGKADAVLVWAYNRLARNPLDGGMIIHLFDSGKLKAIRTPTSLIDGSGNSKFMLSLEFAMSKKSSDDNSESVKRGNKGKILGGWDVRKHAGYIFVDDNTTAERILAPDPVRFSLLQQAIRLVLHGHGVVSVWEKLNTDWGYRTPKTRKLGNKPMSLSNFYKILHDDFYCGRLHTADGEKVEGKHIPMISEQEYESLQRLLGSGDRPRPQGVELPYRGVLKCDECGSSICLEEKHQIICTRCKTKFASKNRDDCRYCGMKITTMNNLHS